MERRLPTLCRLRILFRWLPLPTLDLQDGWCFSIRRGRTTRFIRGWEAAGRCFIWMRQTWRRMASSPSSFQNPKDLKFVITLANQRVPFASGGQTFNTITLQGLRASVYIDNAGGAMMGTLHAQIFGVTSADMNTLTSLLW